MIYIIIVLLKIKCLTTINRQQNKFRSDYKRIDGFFERKKNITINKTKKKDFFLIKYK